MATRIFFLRFSIVTAFAHLLALHCHIFQSIQLLRIIKCFFILDNYKTIFYTSPNLKTNRSILAVLKSLPYIQAC